MIILPEDYFMDRWCVEPSPFAIRPLPTSFSPDVVIDALHGPMLGLDLKVPKEAIVRDISGNTGVYFDVGCYWNLDQFTAIKAWVDFLQHAHKERMKDVKPTQELAEQKPWLNLRKR